MRPDTCATYEVQGEPVAYMAQSSPHRPPGVARWRHKCHLFSQYANLDRQRRRACSLVISPLFSSSGYVFSVMYIGESASLQQCHEMLGISSLHKAICLPPLDKDSEARYEENKVESEVGRQIQGVCRFSVNSYGELIEEAYPKHMS